MTASRFVTGTGVGVLGRALPQEGTSDGMVVADAVAKPAGDGLESSVCGVLATANAAEDWPSTGRSLMRGVRAHRRLRGCHRNHAVRKPRGVGRLGTVAELRR